MSDEKRITAALIIIGDEILSGRTKDKNIGFIADHLTLAGIDLEEVRIVPDNEGRIIDALNALRQTYTYVFTTGGIGPTHDDITAETVARAFGVPIDIDERALKMMRCRYTEEQLKGERLLMARIPQGAELVDNPVSHCPGFRLENVIVMAGIPIIMHAMFDAVLPSLEKAKPLKSISIKVNKVESDVSAPLRDIQAQFPDISIGSYPYYLDGVLGTYIVCRSADEVRLGEVRRLIEGRLV